MEKTEIIGKKIDDRRPVSYTKQKIERKNRLHNEGYVNAQELFFKYLEFYEKNYPKSTHDLEWDDKKAIINVKEGDFEDTLNKLSELELYNVLTVYEYGRKENFSGDMKEHYNQLYATGFVRKRIPGYAEQEKLKRLKNQKRIQERKIKELEKAIGEKRIVFSKTHAVGSNAKISNNTKIVVCEICNKQFATGSGKASHQRSKHPELFENKT